MTALTLGQLRLKLNYCKNTGVFTWAKGASRKMPEGSVAGRLDKDGYVLIGLNYREYRAHRLAWFYFYEKWPDTELDHKNRNRRDNSIDNLREATHSQNLANSTRGASVESPRGVYWDAVHSKWVAKCGWQGKTYFLGRYRLLEDAEAARENFAKQHHGEFYHE